MQTCLIYALSDPRTDEIRYVGQSSTGLKRPMSYHAARCLSWEKSLKRLGLKKQIEILEEWDGTADHKQWLNDSERFWIASWRLMGADLTNLTDGGDGIQFPMPSHIRSKISKSKMGKPSWNKGRPWTEEEKRVLFEAHEGVQLSESHRHNIGLARLGKPGPTKGMRHSAKTRSKMSASHIGKEFSVEHRKNISKARKDFFARKREMLI